MNKKLIFIFLFTFLIRLISLNQSFWLDEATTANVVKNYSYSQILNVFSPNDFHPPFYYLFMKFWTNLFGYSEVSLRFLSIIFSLLTGWIIFKIVEKFKEKNIGLWAMSIFLFNSLIVYYSQEVRMYSLITLLTTLILYYLIKTRSTKHETRSNFINLNFKNSNLLRISNFDIRVYFLAMCNLFIFLSFLTFYGSIFFIVSIYLYLLFKKEFKLFLYLLPGFILSFLLVSPLLYQQFLNSKIVIKEVLNWSLVLGKANIKNLLLIPIKFSIGRISFDPKILYWIMSGLWSIFIFYPVIYSLLSSSTRLRIWGKPDSRSGSGMTGGLFLWIFFLPLILGFVTSFYTPLLQYFRFIYLIPILIILITVSTNKNWQKIIILSGFTIFSFIYLLNPAYHREDWKSLVYSLDKNKSVYMILSSSDPIKYYDNKIEIRDIKNLNNYKLENKIQVIPYSTEIHGVDYKDILSKLGYKIINEKSYRELRVEEWEK